MIQSFIDSWGLFQYTYLTGWLIAALLALIGVIAVARDQIFIGAAVAQASTLGLALLLAAAAWVGPEFHEKLDSKGAQIAAAVLFSILAALVTERTGSTEQGGESHEALLGWIFLVGAAASVLLVSKSPHGLEEVHRLVASSLIGADSTDVAIFAALIAIVAVVLVFRHRDLLLYALDPETAEALGISITRWRWIVTLTFGVTVGLAIRASIFLRGGADILNLIVPYADPEYSRWRPSIGVPDKAKDQLRAVIPLDERFGLHPGLENLKALWDRKLFAPIVCTGSPHPTRSHFDAQDFMEYAAPGLRTVKDGWLNRYLSSTRNRGDGGLRGLAVQRVLPRSARGTFPVLAVSDDGQGATSRLLDTFDDVYGKTPQAGAMTERRDDDDADSAVQVGRDTIENLRRYTAIIEEKNANGGGAKNAAYPKGEFPRQLHRIAQVIKADAGLEVACIDVPGWDHHVNEGGAGGDLLRLTSAVGGGLAAFVEDLGPKIQNTLILIMSEFGRTVFENGNKGTDHGHGSGILAIGGQVKGGAIYGKWTGLDEKRLYEGRDLQVTTDFRTVFDESLTVFSGFEPPKDFFPKYERVKFLKFLS